MTASATTQALTRCYASFASSDGDRKFQTVGTMRSHLCAVHKSASKHLCRHNQLIVELICEFYAVLDLLI